MKRLKNDMLQRIRKVYNYSNKYEAGEEWRSVYSVWLYNKYLFDDLNIRIIEKELKITLNYFNRLKKPI